MADIIHLIDKPIQVTNGAGGTQTQDLRLALDVSAYDELDLLLTVYEGSSLVVDIMTGMQKESEEGWVSTVSFGATSAGGANKLNVQNFLRFVRWQFSTVTTATFLVQGIGRRWA